MNYKFSNNKLNNPRLCSTRRGKVNFKESFNCDELNENKGLKREIVQRLALLYYARQIVCFCVFFFLFIWKTFELKIAKKKSEKESKQQHSTVYVRSLSIYSRKSINVNTATRNINKTKQHQKHVWASDEKKGNLKFCLFFREMLRKMHGMEIEKM